MRKFFTNLSVFVLVLFLFLGNVYAQNIAVRGKVTDAANGEALIGVSIKVKGTTQGTSTDVSGGFTINAPANGVLVLSYVGYGTKEVPISNQTSIAITLKSSASDLDEVVVIGYGTRKKADLTGAIGSVSSADIVRQPALNAAQSIQGKVSGINIISNEAPGSAPTVIIRGLGTALGGRDPLYIVDGFPVDNINSINSADIVSIDILKDASSASIYGIRAANGVVMVTTKKGKSGKTEVSFDSYYGVKDILNSVKMANASQYTEYVNENLAAVNRTWRIADNQANNTDWYDELTQLGQVSNNVLSISGGGETVDYFLSYNYFDEKGILDDFKYNRHTIRNNNQYKLFNNRLKLTQNMNVSFTNEKPKPIGAFNDAYRQSPLVPVWYANGRSGRPFINQSTGVVTYEAAAGQTIGSLNSIGNPVYTVKSYNQYNKTLTLQGGLNAELEITKYLKFNSRFGATKYYSNERSFNDIKDQWLNADPMRTATQFESNKAASPNAVLYADNSLSVKDVETFRWIWENFVTFQKTFDKHNVEATVGLSREKTNVGNSMTAQGYDVPSLEQYWSVDLASLKYTKTVNHLNYTPVALASYFGRVQYNYDSRYYLTATIRRDGTSTFKTGNNYWSNFPSFGLGWTLSNEEFMKDLKYLTFLKLRGSWGKLGNQNVPLNVSQTLTGTGSTSYNYVFGPNQELVNGAAFGSPALPLDWEVTREWGLGLDYSIMNKLNGSFDYYNKTNTNTILSITPTLNSEFSQNFYDHGAKVSNKGIEASLNWQDNLSKDLSYQIGVNYAHNTNKVTDVKPAYDRATGGSLANGQITKQLREGQPIYAWWMYEADGIWQNQQEINNNAHYGSPLPGHIRYKDQNEDGVIDDRDKIYLGSYIPKSTYGIRLSMNYKKFDFNIDGYGVGGNKVYNGLKGTRIDGGENITYDTYAERWKGEGTTNSHPGAARDSYASSYYLESGSYFRINNITLGYTLNNAFTLDGSRLRVYVTAQNPFMFTNYSGFSPEISNDGSPNGTSGIELAAYPTTRNFLFGVNFHF
ncbi:SusC/RagA family TonB-linked outer membrane protein [Arcticibacter tournemirensis]